jgi:hypothetical protein
LIYKEYPPLFAETKVPEETLAYNVIFAKEFGFNSVIIWVYVVPKVDNVLLQEVYVPLHDTLAITDIPLGSAVENLKDIFVFTFPMLLIQNIGVAFPFCAFDDEPLVNG